jgi:uncharacterized protein YqgC (DUF456 family)
MEVFLMVLAVILMLVGVAGCVLPFLPGPPLSYIALLIVAFMDGSQISTNVLIATGVATAIVTLLDYLIPIWGTKWYGGSKQGVWGATVGMVVGIFVFPPFGLIIGPFAGAFIGEMINDSSNTDRALRAAFGSLIGFLVGTGLKVIVCLWMFYYLVVDVWHLAKGM